MSAEHLFYFSELQEIGKEIMKHFGERYALINHQTEGEEIGVEGWERKTLNEGTGPSVGRCENKNTNF